MINREMVSLIYSYMEHYPCEGEPGYDGIHDGDVKCLREDAPDYVKKMYKEFLEIEEQDRKNGTRTI